MVGICEVSTKALPSLAIDPEKVTLLPSISTKVEVRPNPLKLIFVLPCVAPEVNESALFSEPESIGKFAVISEAVIAPILSIKSLPTISTGDAPSVGLPAM